MDATNAAPQIKVLTYEIATVVPYINWIYFFNAWGFAPRYATAAHIHDCPSCQIQWLASFPDTEKEKAAEARQLFNDAQQIIHSLTGKHRTQAIVGLFPAHADGDDILIYGTSRYPTRLPMLRQQHGTACTCWSDFVHPVCSKKKDTIGLFATSVDATMEQSFPNDEYRHLLCQTLADRLAEATAERMHEEVRKSLWGYASDEQLTIQELLQEKYTGRRPAIGYPSLPDQSLNFLIDECLNLSRISIRLTENGAMRPHASTSGLLFAHPQATHFAIGHIGEDQIHDYARRRGLPLETIRKFLAANLPS